MESVLNRQQVMLARLCSRHNLSLPAIALQPVPAPGDEGTEVHLQQQVSSASAASAASTASAAEAVAPGAAAAAAAARSSGEVRCGTMVEAGTVRGVGAVISGAEARRSGTRAASAYAVGGGGALQCSEVGVQEQQLQSQPATAAATGLIAVVEGSLWQPAKPVVRSSISRRGSPYRLEQQQSQQQQQQPWRLPGKHTNEPREIGGMQSRSSTAPSGRARQSHAWQRASLNQQQQRQLLPEQDQQRTPHSHSAQLPPPPQQQQRDPHYHSAQLPQQQQQQQCFEEQGQQLKMHVNDTRSKDAAWSCSPSLSSQLPAAGDIHICSSLEYVHALLSSIRYPGTNNAAGPPANSNASSRRPTAAVAAAAVGTAGPKRAPGRQVLERLAKRAAELQGKGTTSSQWLGNLGSKQRPGEEQTLGFGVWAGQPDDTNAASTTVAAAAAALDMLQAASVIVPGRSSSGFPGQQKGTAAAAAVGSPGHGGDADSSYTWAEGAVGFKAVPPLSADDALVLLGLGKPGQGGSGEEAGLGAESPGGIGAAGVEAAGVDLTAGVVEVSSRTLSCRDKPRQGGEVPVRPGLAEAPNVIGAGSAASVGVSRGYNCGDASTTTTICLKDGPWPHLACSPTEVTAAAGALPARGAPSDDVGGGDTSTTTTSTTAAGAGLAGALHGVLLRHWLGAGRVTRTQSVLLGAVTCMRKLRWQQQQGERELLVCRIKQVGHSSSGTDVYWSLFRRIMGSISNSILNGTLLFFTPTLWLSQAQTQADTALKCNSLDKGPSAGLCW